jgi:transcription elongation factor GreB
MKMKGSFSDLQRLPFGMSKAFGSEETKDPPPVVAPRSPIPHGVSNYVTLRGLALLREELGALEASGAPAARVAELEERVRTATLVDPSSQPKDEVRFGARVVVRGESGIERRYQLVGIDEADAPQGKIAFIAPLARALLGKKLGETAVVHTPQGEEELKVLSIEYDPAPTLRPGA